jgi:hypothetical protein
MKITQNTKKNILIGGGLAATAVLAIALFSKKDNSGNYTDPTGNGAITPASFNPTKVADELYKICIKIGRASFLNPGQKDEIISVLKKVSASQFAQVMTKFGKRPYNRTWNNNYFLIGTDPTYYPLDVILKDELLEEDYQTLKQKYPNSL